MYSLSSSELSRLLVIELALTDCLQFRNKQVLAFSQPDAGAAKDAGAMNIITSQKCYQPKIQPNKHMLSHDAAIDASSVRGILSTQLANNS